MSGWGKRRAPVVRGRSGMLMASLPLNNSTHSPELIHHLLRIAPRLDVEAQQGFGIGSAQVHAPVAELEADAVGGVQCRVEWCVMLLHRADGRLGVIHLEVDFATAG